MRAALTLLAAVASACTSIALEAPEPALSSRPSSRCNGQLEWLRGPEIVAAVVGTSIRFAGEQGVCVGAISITSAWVLSLKTDSHYGLAMDRSGAGGRYQITDDQICLDGRLDPCMNLYRDQLGRLYLGSEDERTHTPPAMITVEPIQSSAG
jgi:hypothetical protein